uniref:Uncharacterized protein n=1 Tax=Rhizophora mucronata TaxID=61149 RepID=A0A2P2K7M6_RHIMU
MDNLCGLVSVLLPNCAGIVFSFSFSKKKKSLKYLYMHGIRMTISPCNCC